jgi:2-polyprenyl-6-methoxyphenol hydroxylase-like FAD-dependent oxidoreductase
MLLNAAERHQCVEITFNRCCTHYETDEGVLTFADETTSREEDVKAPVVIAADGAWSAVRKAMLERIENFNYSQNFLEFGYKELVIPPADDGGFRMEPNALHIWPRHSYMMIALPNTEGSFTVMAVENFVEMRDSVTDPRFLLRKKVGFELEKRWPDRFIPRYSMVIFRPDIPYADAQRRGAAQDRILDQLCAPISTPEQVDWAEAERLLQQII